MRRPLRPGQKKPPRGRRPPPKNASLLPDVGEYPDLRSIEFTEEEHARIERLAAIWSELRDISYIVWETRGWLESGPDRERLAVRLAHLLEQLRGEYPGIKPTSVPAMGELLRTNKQMERARHMISSASTYRGFPHGAAQSAIRLADSVQLVFSRVQEMAGIFVTLHTLRDPIFVMSLWQAHCAMQPQTAPEPAPEPAPGGTPP